ncbi:MAG: PIN domain-containing protein [Candidatus Thermoplasmatota archaeon]
MRIADTSVLYGAFVIEDAHHVKARAALGDEEPLVIPSEIFAETIALLQRRLGFEHAREAGSGLRDLPHVRIEGSSNAIVRSAWQEFEEASGALSLPDAFVVAWCRTEGARPLSFDKRLFKRAGGSR